MSVTAYDGGRFPEGGEGFCSVRFDERIGWIAVDEQTTKTRRGEGRADESGYVLWRGHKLKNTKKMKTKKKRNKKKKKGSPRRHAHSMHMATSVRIPSLYLYSTQLHSSYAPATCPL